MADRLYFAYGSNINLEQMAERCPAAEVVGPAVLDGYELLFRGNRSGYGVATIEPLPNSQVHGLLWKLTPECEQSLDFYEGYPRLYEKEDVTVRTEDGKELTVMAYVMTHELWRDPVVPSSIYYGGILDGYRQNGLPVPALETALRNTHDEVRQNRFFERMQEIDLILNNAPHNTPPNKKKGKDTHER